MSATPNPRDTKTQQAVKTFVASTDYELASGSTLHQVHNATAQDDPEVIQDIDDDDDMDKDDKIDDEIAYLGTSQPGQLGISNLPTDTDTAPVLKSKKQKSTKPKTEDKATEAVLREKS